MGVCCIVFVIDGMLFEFFMIFLNIEKKKIRIYFFNISCFLHVLCYFQHLRKIWCTNFFRRGGVEFFFFFEKHFFIISFRVYAIFNINKKIGNINKCPITYWLNGRWFLQIVDRDSGNLYPI